MTTEIHPGVQLLVKRMQSNPEEFLADDRWYYTIQQYRPYFSVVEEAAFKDAERCMHLTQMEACIMRELLDPAPKQSEAWSYSPYSPQSHTTVVPTTQIANYRHMLGLISTP